jgi:phosphatidylglycerol lysyltransferase
MVFVLNHANAGIDSDSQGTAPLEGPVATASASARVRGLLERYGQNPTSFQILDGSCRYWFTDDAVVAYFDTGTALVVAGAPICASQALPKVTARFAAAAARHKRSAVFFGVHERFLSRTGLPATPIGELLSWRPQDWPSVLARAPSLRAQLRRATRKGLRIEKLQSDLGPLLPQLRAMRARWLGQKGMAPMSFLAKPIALEASAAPGRTALVAWRGEVPVGYLWLSPIYARRGALVQEWVRDSRAPNGTSEVLLDAAFRWAADEGLRYATLGLSPLAGSVPMWLRAARVLGRPCFDFEGLQTFKAKLRPHRREVVAVAGLGASPATQIVESLRAFAGGSLMSFGAATLRMRLGI